MRQAVLIAFWLLWGSSTSVMADSNTYRYLNLTPVERTVLVEHIGKHAGAEVLIVRSAEFPEVLRISARTNNSDSAAWAKWAIMVSGAWLDGGDSGFFMSRPTFWFVDEITRQILQARGWSTLDTAKRKALALRWIIDSRPLDSSIQSAAYGGHAPIVEVQGSDVVVRVWLVNYLTNIAGRHAIVDPAPRVFRIKPDGSMTEQSATAVEAVH